QRIGLDGVDHYRRVGTEDADEAVAGHDAFGRNLDAGRKAELVERAAGVRPGALPARHAEAEELGVAQREPAFGLVRHRQVERLLAALLDALDRGQLGAEAVAVDLALADGDEQFALAGMAEGAG